ncbi:carbonic anhydrase [Mucilaginibacter sp. OK283]|uniref:carbonic anhydrase n=1 Tax=Mucilaginibacter sp. OK283 TaxID=1881049 RepID=UPI0008C4D0A4|nr:carbonic anhydrase [Mucilaginibacter sp. OK283]SEO93249.1 carbonic anhydrase [Mucilaginibacter sp. OK283]
MTNFSQFEFRNLPGFDQNTFDGFDKAIPMKTLVIYCFDPRAAEIPKAVADHLGDEVYPGENITDENGVRIGHTRTLFALSNGGGRALQSLQSIATMDYLFHYQNVVIVHHSFCGMTSYTPELLIEKFHTHHHTDISGLWDHEDMAIEDYEKTIKHDVDLLDHSPLVPKHLNLYGFFYEINSGELTEVVRVPASERSAS